MLTQSEIKEKRELQKELLFFIENYKEIAHRAPQVADYYNQQIFLIVERLKELGR